MLTFGTFSGFPQELVPLAIELALYVPYPEKPSKSKTNINDTDDTAIDMTGMENGMVPLTPDANGSPPGMTMAVPGTMGMPDVGFKQAGKLDAMGNPLPSPPPPEKKPKRKRKDIIAELDWWSKYYVTKIDMVRTVEGDLNTII